MSTNQLKELTILPSPTTPIASMSSMPPKLLLSPVTPISTKSSPIFKLPTSSSSTSLSPSLPLTYSTNESDYTLLAQIGTGSFGSVYEAIYVPSGASSASGASGEHVAIKIIDLEILQHDTFKDLHAETTTLSQMNHPNLLKVYTTFVSGTSLWIVTQLFKSGSCAFVLKHLFPHGIKDEALLATILLEIVKGLAYMHKDARIHRDIKAGNILLSATGDIVIADFGVACHLNGYPTRNTFTGTPCWMAPEVFDGNNYNQSVDIWSLGITALELAFGHAPYSNFHPHKIAQLILNEAPPSCDTYTTTITTPTHSGGSGCSDVKCSAMSQTFQHFVGKCLRKDPLTRKTAQRLLKHKFFRNAQDKAYIVKHIVSKLPTKTSMNIGAQSTKHSTNEKECTAHCAPLVSLVPLQNHPSPTPLDLVISPLLYDKVNSATVPTQMPQTSTPSLQ